MEHLTSRQNTLVKYIRSLAQRKVRERERCFVVEGVRLLEEALKTTEKRDSPFLLEIALICRELVQNERSRDLIQGLQTAGVKTFTVSAEILESLADTVSPQGMLGIIRRKNANKSLQMEVPDTSDSEVWPLILILDRIQDPGNLGTLLRTAEAAKVSEVWLTKGTADPFSPKVLRATMGSIFRVPILTEVEYARVIELGINGVSLIATGIESGLPYYQTNFCQPLAILLGNEANGLADCLKVVSKEMVTIPLGGDVESLNVAVAGAVLLFEIQRQRKTK